MPFDPNRHLPEGGIEELLDKQYAWIENKLKEFPQKVYDEGHEYFNIVIDDEFKRNKDYLQSYMIANHVFEAYLFFMITRYRR
jgi:hypothetical protein